jgi:fatty acid synthase subunit alpha
LWAAEDIEAVFDQDPQRVCILQGPVAVKHSKVKDEPIKDLLDNINSSLIRQLLDSRYGGDEAQIPSLEYLGAKVSNVSPDPLASFGIVRETKEDKVSYTLKDTVPDASLWLEEIAGPQIGWWRALVCSPIVVQGTSYIDNPIRRLLAPRLGQKVVVSSSSPSPSTVVVYGAARSHGLHDPGFKAVDIQYTAASKLINVTIFEERRKIAVPLHLRFAYKPSMGSAPIHEIADDRNMRIKEFYWKLWFGDQTVLPNIDISETFTAPEITIDVASVEKFCGIVGNEGESFKAVRNEDVKAPMDFAIVTGWQVRCCVLENGHSTLTSSIGNH